MRAAEAEIARMPDDPADTNTFTSLYDYWLPINTIISQARATQRGY
jgi:hypothetical protein